MKLIKSKFFVITVAVAIFLCLFSTVLSLIGGFDLLRSGVSLVATPFRAVFNWAADGIEGFAEYFSGVDALVKENAELRAELEKYRQDAARAELAEGENDWLRQQLGFVDTYSEYTFKDARVIGRSSNSYSVTYTLDRGSESGIKVNMAVITPEGVVGYVREVGLTWCRAVAITDPTSAVGAYSPEGAYGTVEGSVEHRADGFCIMTSDVSGLSVGSTLYASGYGNIYPAGLPIGKIVSSTKDKYSRMTTYVIEPAVDFDTLGFVLIVTEKSVTEEAPPEDNGHEK